ncbi:SdiA-regulated domain-containing protein [Primorskyibacter sp. S87]|uniref:SdiA-regulated domain-containing protein n=1 Tax=Primorskyibacter sp. S87 TaxID=3415126 RepID=UPI003C7BA177
MALWVNGALAADLLMIDRFKIRDEAAGYSEPSGLSMSSINGHLWSVSDAEAKLHLMTVGGDLVNAFRLPEGTGTDLEGVTARPDGAVLMLMEQDWSVSVLYPEDPPRIERLPLSAMRGFAEISPLLEGNPDNKGPEGIATDPETGAVYVSIEGQPRLLLTLSPGLDEILDALELKSDLGFVSPHANDEELDVSGLAWSASSGLLWMLSDTGRRIFVFDPRENTVATIELEYEKDGKTKSIRNAEGIALDEEAGRLFVLTDDGKKSRLFVFEMPAL